MAIYKYTNEELRHLRSSPLVKKPERLPPIEQWIEYVYADGSSREKLRIPHSESQQNVTVTNKAARVPAGRVPRPAVSGDGGPMGNFSTGQRPSLLQTRTAGSRSGGMAVDQTSGPSLTNFALDDFMPLMPKVGFTSNRSIPRFNSFGNEPPIPDSTHDEQDGRIRTTGDRQHARKTTFDRESWSNVRERRALGENEHSRTDSNGERNTRQPQRERDGDKQESRWGPKDDRRQNGDRQAGGWRDRETNRRDRGWDRNDHNEREPEWFDEPAIAKQDGDLASMSQPRTQEDFQKWKAMMNSNNKHQNDVEPQVSTIAAPPPREEHAQKSVETLKLDGVAERPFGSFSAVKSPDSANAQSNKAKASRFASMFKKEDTIPSPVPEPEPMQHPPASAPPIMPTQHSTEEKEDKEGFRRILQMLGGTDINTAASPIPAEPRSPPRSTASGARQRSRFFDPVKSPENASSAQLQAFVSADSLPATQTRTPSASKATQATVIEPQNSEKSHGQGTDRPPHERTSSDYQGGASTPDINLLSLLANQRTSRPAASNKDSEFLLGLLQGNSARPATRTGPQPTDFPLWLNSQAGSHTSNPKGRPPPGHVEDHGLHNAIEGQQRGPQQPGEQYIDRSVPPQMHRAPPGFDEARLYQALQQRHASNGFPQQQFDDAQSRRPPGLPPGMTLPPHAIQHQKITSPLSAHGPHDLPFMHPGPPGLPVHLRHPQDFANVPNMFPPHQQHMPGQPQHFANGPPQPIQQGGSVPPGFGRGMPQPNNGSAPPGLAAINRGGIPVNGSNGFHGRAQQPGIYEPRR